jgi:hypothetical protein
MSSSETLPAGGSKCVVATPLRVSVCPVNACWHQAGRVPLAGHAAVLFAVKADRVVIAVAAEEEVVPEPLPEPLPELPEPPLEPLPGVPDPLPEPVEPLPEPVEPLPEPVPDEPDPGELEPAENGIEVRVEHPAAQKRQRLKRAHKEHTCSLFIGFPYKWPALPAGCAVRRAYTNRA